LRYLSIRRIRSLSDTQETPLVEDGFRRGTDFWIPEKMEDSLMYPYETPHYKAVDARRHHVLDTIGACGPFASHVLAAEERRRQAENWAAVWTATHGGQVRTPGRWRRWFGTILVRAGTRLQGPASSAPAELAQVMN
jgi:hypothetical protein